MIVIDRKKSKSEWVQYDEEVSFLIRPFPISEKTLSPSGLNIYEVLFKRAMYCLQDWKGIVDVNGNEVKCDPDNKKFILDYSEEIINFVCEKSSELGNKIVNMPVKKT